MNIYPSDVAIRKAILAAIDAVEWAPHTAIQITVANGIVEFAGCAADRLERAKLTALAKEVSGVANVIDHLTLSAAVAPPATTESKQQDDLALAAFLTQ